MCGIRVRGGVFGVLVEVLGLKDTWRTQEKEFCDWVGVHVVVCTYNQCSFH